MVRKNRIVFEPFHQKKIDIFCLGFYKVTRVWKIPFSSHLVLPIIIPRTPHQGSVVRKNAQVDWFAQESELFFCRLLGGTRWWLLRCPVCKIIKRIIHFGNCEIGKASRRHLGRQKRFQRRRDMRSKVSRARRLGPDAVGRAETLVQIEKHDASATRRKRRRRQRNETRANVLANARRSAVLRVYRVLVREERIVG